MAQCGERKGLNLQFLSLNFYQVQRLIDRCDSVEYESESRERGTELVRMMW